MKENRGNRPRQQAVFNELWASATTVVISVTSQWPMSGAEHRMQFRAVFIHFGIERERDDPVIGFATEEEVLEESGELTGIVDFERGELVEIGGRLFRRTPYLSASPVISASFPPYCANRSFIAARSNLSGSRFSSMACRLRFFQCSMRSLYKLQPQPTPPSRNAN